MQSGHRPEPLELCALSRSRSASTPTDLQFSKRNVLSPPPVVPSPAYVAASAAAQIVSADERNGIDLDEEEDSESTPAVSVTPQSLSLLNGFLDYILFNILAAAKSTRLGAVRPAIAEVLKPRFAKEVIAAADEELSEYMSDEDDEEAEFRGGRGPHGEFDLIRSWKLTRLRCMVYTRLGDMEEEDEDEYIDREGLNDMDVAHRRFSTYVGNITPAAAIFLTSIIEYIGEQALLIAGETARSRMSAKVPSNRDSQVESGSEHDYQLVVEESDMEKLALNATLGRLWRTWKKRVRTPGLSRTLSRESMLRRGFYTPTSVNSRKSSVATIEEAEFRDAVTSRRSAEEPEEVDPASIALPMTENDVREIEIPGLADLDGEIQTMEARVAHKVRPRSLMVVSSLGGLHTSTSPASASPRVRSAVELTFGNHNRAWSLPTPTNTPRPNPTPEERDNEDEFVTPSEEKPQLETMYENEETTILAEPHNEVPAESTSEYHSVPERHDSLEPAADIHPEEADDAREVHVEPAQTAQQVNEVNSYLDSTSADVGRVEQEEVIEGQGMREKQKLSSSMQRPKRKSSREVSHKDSKSTLLPETSEPVIQNAAGEKPLSMERTTSLHEPDATSTPPKVDLQEVKKHTTPSQKSEKKNIKDATTPKSDSRQVSSGTISLPPTPELPEVPEVRRKPSPASRHVSHSSESIGGPVSTSDESDRSIRSRPRSRTNPRTPSGSQHRHERSSPAIGTESERAAVQRVTGPVVPREPSDRRSESISSRDRRPVTAGSTTSGKFKGLIGRSQSTHGSNRLRSASQASKSSERPIGLPDEDKSGLDQLIDSEETIHYTLTPRNMRQMDTTDARAWRAPRSSTLELAEFLKNTAPPGEDQRPANMRGVNGLRAHPPEKPPAPKFKPIEISKPTSAPARAPKLKTVQARDPRPSAGSTRDFAEFIRSTGPGVSDMGSKTPTSISQRPATTSRDQVAPKRAGPRLQARPATASKEDQTSDLIDFIREGPPTAGGRRIPKTVAPFRNTMDSDELLSLGVRADNETTAASSLASTQTGSMHAKSINSSDNSRTGLMESVNRANARTSPIVQQSAPSSSFKGKPSSFPSGDDEMRPVRKQRRVRDPYAIDSEDEDDLDELLETPKTKPAREESLLDFLRSEPPPGFDSEPPRPFAISSVPPKSSGSMSAASAMKARLLRNTSLDKFPTAKQSKSSLRSRRPTTGTVNSGSSSTLSPGANYAQQTSYNKGSLNNFSSGQTGYTARVGREQSSGRQTETSALADFLRNTAPPEPPTYRPSPSSDDKSGSFTKLFSRRKKIEA